MARLPPVGGRVLNMRGARAVGRSLIVSCVILSGAFLALAIPAKAHSFDAIDSLWATSPPTIDGMLAPGEWADATDVDLGAIAGNVLPSHILVKNNDTLLWIAYDATGDLTPDADDAAAIAFDTGHDATETAGDEDQFVLDSGGMPSAHWVSDGAGGWNLEDAPFDTLLADHAFLDGARGFAPSDLEPLAHRSFEFQIPLALLGAAPGGDIGFFGGAMVSPGVVDAFGFAYSTWPQYVLAPIPLWQYGDLTLQNAPGLVDVAVTPSQSRTMGFPGDTVWFNFTVQNRGTLVDDTFDFTQLGGAWNATLWDATGTVLLTDTDGDALNDTGNVTSGTSVDIVLKVDIPPGASGCDASVFAAQSSWVPFIFDIFVGVTCVPEIWFTPPHSDMGVDLDLPPDGTFDVLRLNVSMNSTVTSNYLLLGTLYDGTGSFVITQANVVVPTAGAPLTMDLDFSGLDLYNSGIDGPYLVQLDLLDFTFRPVDSDTYMTGAYLWTAFDPPGVTFAPPHSDYGLDSDLPPNGLYDDLFVDVSLDVVTPGDYILTGNLLDFTGATFISFNVAFATLPAGPAVVTLQFPGMDIWNAGIDGPYLVQLAIYDGLVFALQDTDVYLTSAYLASQFDPPALYFTPPHSDFAVDVDGDLVYDRLTVRAVVNITEAGAYRIDSALYDSTGTTQFSTTTVTTYRTPGVQTIDLEFPGPDVYDSGYVGTFLVPMVAYDATGSILYDFDIYATGSYDFSQFRQRLAVFAPPHSDSGIDVSVPADGSFDWLQLDVMVDAIQATTLTVDAYLYDAGDNFIDTVRVTQAVPLGVSAIPVQFDGHFLRDRGFPGPYRADLVLWDDAGNFLDLGSHVTGPYDWSEFQPMDFTAPTSTALVGGSYWRNTAPVDVDFSATDPQLGDGVASVDLYYRHSVDNASWSGWTWFDAMAFAPGLSSVTGTFAFDAPLGEGYYEFYTAAADHGGNAEVAAGSSQASVAVFIPTSLDVSPVSSLITAGGQTTLTVTVLNGAGQVIPLEQDLVASLSADSATGEFRAVGTGIPVTTVTIPAGGSSADVDYYDITAGTATLLVATFAAAPGTATVDVSAGPATAIAIDPTAVTLTVGASQSFTATLWDSFGNPAAGAVTWSATPGLGSITGAGVLTAATTVTTGSVTASSGLLTATADVTLLAGPLASVNVTPTTGTLLNGTSLDIAAWALDAYGNPVWGAAFTWSVTGPGSLSATTGMMTTVTADDVGTIVVTATSGAQSASATLTSFAPPPVGPGPLDHIEVYPAVSTLTVGSSLPLQAFALDAAGTILPGVTFSWTLTGPGTLSAISGDSVEVTATGPGAITVTVTAGSSTDTSVITGISTGPGPVATVEVLPATATIVDGSTLSLSAFAWDASGDVVPTATFAWTVVSGPGTLSAATGDSVTLTATDVGVITVTATSSGQMDTAVITVRAQDPGLGPLADVVVAPTAANILNGSMLVLSAWGFDATGAQVAATFTWTVVSGPGTLSAATGSTTTLTATGAGTIVVTVTSGTFTKTVTITSTAQTTGGGGPGPVGGGGDLTLGLIGGLVIGLVAGILVGWLLLRKKKTPPEPEVVATPAEPTTLPTEGGHEFPPPADEGKLPPPT